MLVGLKCAVGEGEDPSVQFQVKASSSGLSLEIVVISAPRFCVADLKLVAHSPNRVRIPTRPQQGSDVESERGKHCWETLIRVCASADHKRL